MRHILKATVLLTTSNGDKFMSVGNYNTIRVKSFEFEDVERALQLYHFNDFTVVNMVSMERTAEGLTMKVNIK